MDKHGKGAYTLIGEGSTLEGLLVVPHAIRIDGTVRGKADGSARARIETSEMLTIGTTAHIEADIWARSAVIGGKVKGNLTIQDRTELESAATLVGDLKTRELVINEGALFHGNCTMDKDNGKAVKV